MSSPMSRLASCAASNNKRPCPGYAAIPDLFPKCPVGYKWVQKNSNEWHCCLAKGGTEIINLSSLTTTTPKSCTIQQPYSVSLRRSPVQLYFAILEHLVLPSDTFMGICLRYKINANKLRQFNRFSGSNLALAPSKLYIPILSEQLYKKVKIQDVTTEEYKVTLMLHHVPSLSRKVAAAYLRICNGNIDDAVEEASGDLDWETNHESLMLERILSLRDKKQHEEEEARYLEKLRRSENKNFCIKAFESFLKDHGVVLKKANENEMWFEMTHDILSMKPSAQKMSRTPSMTSLSSVDGSMSDDEDDQYQHLLSKEYGETKPSSRSFAYSVKYDMASHRLQTTSTRHQQYHQYGPQQIGEEIKAAAIAVEQKLFDVLAIFQNHGYAPETKPRNNNSMAIHEEETVAFFELTNTTKAKIA